MSTERTKSDYLRDIVDADIRGYYETLRILAWMKDNPGKPLRITAAERSTTTWGVGNPSAPMWSSEEQANNANP